MMRFRSIQGLLVALAAGAPAPLAAQAFGLNEIGTCAVARAFAATASPCRDASTIYWNPAAATALSGWSAVAGVAMIALDGNFDQDTTFRRFDADVPTSIVPHVFVNYHKPASRFAYGLGVYVPYGLTSEWRDDFPGRFAALKATLTTVYVQPNFAWRLDSSWSVGGGPIIGHSSVELIQALDLSAQIADPTTLTTFGMLGVAQGTEFARARLKGSATAFGAQIGIWGHPAADWSVGLRALTPLQFRYSDGDATFSQTPTGLTVGGTIPGTPFQAGTPIDALLAGQFTSGGALVSQRVSTRVNHPAQVQAGVAYSGFDRWLLEADYAWVGWQTFRELPIDFAGPAQGSNTALIEDYDNTSSIRLGAEYAVRKDGWTMRGGFAAASSAAPAETVTPLLPEQDRTYWTIGTGVPVNSTWAIDASYAHVGTPGARGRIVERVSRSQTAAQLNSGVFHLSANVVSLGVKATF